MRVVCYSGRVCLSLPQSLTLELQKYLQSSLYDTKHWAEKEVGVQAHHTLTHMTKLRSFLFFADLEKVLHVFNSSRLDCNCNSFYSDLTRQNIHRLRQNEFYHIQRELSVINQSLLHHTYLSIQYNNNVTIIDLLRFYCLVLKALLGSCSVISSFPTGLITASALVAKLFQTFSGSKISVCYRTCCPGSTYISFFWNWNFFCHPTFIVLAFLTIHCCIIPVLLKITLQHCFKKCFYR